MDEDDYHIDVKSFFFEDEEGWNEWLANNSKVLESQYRVSTYYYSYIWDNIINRGIRTGKLSESGYLVARRLTHLLDKSQPNPEEITLYRGIVKTSDYDLTSLKPGDIITDPSFMSMSLSQSKANEFLDKESCCCLMFIRYPKLSAKFLYISKEYSALGIEEYEMITYPGQMLQLTEYDKESGWLFFDFIGYDRREPLLNSVDLSIDNKFIEFIESFREVYSNYMLTVVIGKDDSIKAFSPDDDVVEEYSYGYPFRVYSLDEPNGFIMLYSYFSTARIKSIKLINGFPTYYNLRNKNIIYSYDNDGIIITTGVKNKESYKEYLKKLAMGLVVNQDLNIRTFVEEFNIDFNISVTPQRVKSEHELDIINLEKDWDKKTVLEKKIYISSNYFDEPINEQLGYY